MVVAAGVYVKASRAAHPFIAAAGCDDARETVAKFRKPAKPKIDDMVAISDADYGFAAAAECQDRSRLLADRPARIANSREHADQIGRRTPVCSPERLCIQETNAGHFPMPNAGVVPGFTDRPRWASWS
jgi:hypothetical protein